MGNRRRQLFGRSAGFRDQPRALLAQLLFLAQRFGQLVAGAFLIIEGVREPLDFPLLGVGRAGRQPLQRLIDELSSFVAKSRQLAGEIVDDLGVRLIRPLGRGLLGCRLARCFFPSPLRFVGGRLIDLCDLSARDFLGLFERRINLTGVAAIRRLKCLQTLLCLGQFAVDQRDPLGRRVCQLIERLVEIAALAGQRFAQPLRFGCLAPGFGPRLCGCLGVAFRLGNLFELGDINADVDDGSFTGTVDGGVTIDDLLYYLIRFEDGC